MAAWPLVRRFTGCRGVNSDSGISGNSDAMAQNLITDLNNHKRVPPQGTLWEQLVAQRRGLSGSKKSRGGSGTDAPRLTALDARPSFRLATKTKVALLAPFPSCKDSVRRHHPHACLPAGPPDHPRRPVDARFPLIFACPSPIMPVNSKHTGIGILPSLHWRHTWSVACRRDCSHR